MSNSVQSAAQPRRAALVELTEIKDPNRGALGIAETPTHVPFPIRRVLTHYDLPLNDRRGHHAHRELEEFIICLTGSVEVEIIDETGMRSFCLDTPRTGLYVPSLTWVTVKVLALATTCVVMTSADYDPNEYIEDMAELQALFARRRSGNI